MLTSDFNYNLPPELIAQNPADPRDSSRLMVVDKNTQTIKHEHFFDIVNYLQTGDLLVWNNTKVFKARLSGEILLDIATDDIDDAREEKINPTGKILNAPKKVEIFLVRPMENNKIWKVLAKPGKKLRLGMKVKFAADFEGEVVLKDSDGTVLMQFADDDMGVRAKANLYGDVPTPPYVNKKQLTIKNEQVSERYQTVYAKHEGAVAAPTAGFHFTPELIERLKQKGVQFAEVTLHVGLGTFLPVKTEKVEDHRMHSEWIELTAKNRDLINTAKVEGRRVVAVGTTTVRVLEGIANMSLRPAQSGEAISPQQGDRHAPSGIAMTSLPAYTGDINIFITPGFEFKIVDALITNFHLPESTLLMLVAAFAGDRLVDCSLGEGREFILRCYEEAVKEKYRFYSFGDAMLIK